MISYRAKLLFAADTQSALQSQRHLQNRFFAEATKLKKQKDRFLHPHRRLLPPLPLPRSNMAIEPAEKVPFILTSGASGRISALLSPRSLRSLVSVLVNALLLLLLLPFRGRKQQRCISNSALPAGPKGAAAASVVAAARRRSTAEAVGDQADVAARRALAIRRVIQDKDMGTVRDFSLFVTGRGDTMFTQSWAPPASINIRGVVVLLHGLNEHSGRYDDFAKLLATDGYKVYGMDWIGHGGSDGLHAYVHSLDDVVADMKIFLKKVVAENPGLPCFCFGHSTGGAIVIKAALDPAVEAGIAGIVITSPAVGVQPAHPIYGKIFLKKVVAENPGLPCFCFGHSTGGAIVIKAALDPAVEASIAGIVITSPAVGVQPAHPIYGVLAPVVSFLLPRYQFSGANKEGAVVSRDPEALASKYSDPLVYTGGIRVRTGYEILRISSYLQRNLSRLRIPFLVLHGSADCITDPEFSLKLYRQASSVDKTIKLLEGLLHDLLIEPERDDISRDIIEWLNSKLEHFQVGI